MEGEQRFTREELIKFIKDNYRPYDRDKLLDSDQSMIFMPKEVEEIVKAVDEKGSGAFFYLEHTIEEKRNDEDEVTIHVSNVNIVKDDGEYIYNYDENK